MQLQHRIDSGVAFPILGTPHQIATRPATSRGPRYFSNLAIVALPRGDGCRHDSRRTGIVLNPQPRADEFDPLHQSLALEQQPVPVPTAAALVASLVPPPTALPDADRLAGGLATGNV